MGYVIQMSEWFLTAEERGNPSTDIDRDGSWVEGNAVRLLVHGSTYFQRLYDELCALQAGDRVYFTDWRGDADELLRPEGPAIGEVLCELARSGVEVRGLPYAVPDAGAAQGPDAAAPGEAAGDLPGSTRGSGLGRVGAGSG